MALQHRATFLTTLTLVSHIFITCSEHTICFSHQEIHHHLLTHKDGRLYQITPVEKKKTVIYKYTTLFSDTLFP